MLDQESLRPVIIAMALYITISTLVPLATKPTGIQVIDDLTMSIIARRFNDEWCHPHRPYRSLPIIFKMTPLEHSLDRQVSSYVRDPSHEHDYRTCLMNQELIS